MLSTNPTPEKSLYLSSKQASSNSINARHLEPQEVSSLRHSFTLAEPFPHFVIDSFLDHSLAKALVENFPPFKAGNYLNELGKPAMKSSQANITKLAAPFQTLDSIIKSEEFLNWISSVTGIPKLLYDPEYVGGGTHENLHGQELNPHIDFNYHPTTGWHRRLSLILYLNPRWENEWGGELEFINDPLADGEARIVKSAAPIFNRLVCFPTTESSWHGFPIIQIPEHELAKGTSRKSFAFFLYTKERPAREIRPLHGTIYYERPLPANLQSGKALTEAEVKEIKTLSGRRDVLLKTLYERELAYSNLTGELRGKLQQNEKILAQLEENFRLLKSSDVTRSLGRDSRLQPKLKVVGANLFELESGLFPDPLLTPGVRVKIQEYNAEQGDAPLPSGALAIISAKPLVRDDEETDANRPATVVQIINHLKGHYGVHQVHGLGVALISQNEIIGSVTAIISPSGISEKFSTKRPKLTLANRALLLLNCAVLLFNKWHNEHLGKIKSPLLWRLSLLYRRMLKSFAVDSPQIVAGLPARASRLTHLRACPSCDNSSLDKIREIGSLYSGNDTFPKPFYLVECLTCSLIYLHTAPSKAELESLYTEISQFDSWEYSEERTRAIVDYYSSVYKNLIAANPNFAQKNERELAPKILEVGAGLAWMSRAVKEASPRAVTICQDISEEALNQATWADEYLIGDLEALMPKLEKHGGFQIISMTHVIEHLLDPLSVLRQLRPLLAKDGLILITTPHRPIGWKNESPFVLWRDWSYCHTPQHLQYYNRKSMETLAARAGYKIHTFDDTQDSGQAITAWLAL